MSKTITLYEVIQSHTDRLQDNLWTAIPAVVKSYDAAKQSIEAIINLRQLLPATGEDLGPITLSDVPVIFQGGGGGVLSFPLTSGDKVLLLFSKYSIDSWKEGTSGVVGENRQHNLNDAVAVPGLVDLKTNLKPSAEDVELKFKQTSVILKASGDVEINPAGVAIINANTTVNGDVTVNGTVTATTDVIGGGKSLKNHKHGGVQSGGSQTTPPV